MTNSDKAWFWAGGYAAGYWSSHSFWQSLAMLAITFPAVWFLYWLMDRLAGLLRPVREAA